MTMENTDPFVSFVLPAYKQQFLAAAIQSILDQRYANFELIIVDDASPENLAAVVAEFTDPRIRFYSNEQNIGGKDLVRNWNQCLTHATGEWVVLASDDDIYSPFFLEKLLALNKRFPNLDLFYCRFHTIDSFGETVSYSEPCLTYETAEEFIFFNLIQRRQQVAPNFMFRRTAIEQIGGFVNLPLAWGADDATWCTLTLGKGAAYCEDVLFQWRFSGANISSQKSNLIEKSRSRLLFLDYCRDKIIPSLREDNAVSAYYAKLIRFHYENSFKGEIIHALSHAKSFKIAYKSFQSKPIRSFIGLIGYVKMMVNIVYFKLSGK
ncbi:Glycosyl transferase family 2 [Sphingobacterium lactis]|uniref:Glycosyl transferase family 2 n=2 Tax=Sphingobacterium lactis TaxID=797291 RepID=A0A1H6CKL6_9SPHI|nr:Glycosyl transferase family 2 [Sphingobacterium lactis]